MVLGALPFHSNPSCNLKNSRNAGSSFREARSLVDCDCDCFEGLAGTKELRRSAALLDLERQIWARRPSSWRRPFLILIPSFDER